MEITAIFVAILAIMYVFISARISLFRGKYGVNLGSGDQPELQRAIRIQGNFIEYVPLLLLMLGSIEYLAAPAWLVWGFGGVVVLGRLLHAYGMWTPDTPGWGRMAGMICTYTPLALGAAYLLVLVLL